MRFAEIPMVVSAIAVTACSAGTQADSTALSTRDVATAFLQQAYGQGDLLEAYEHFAVPDFIQHDPAIADGHDGLRIWLEESGSQLPAASDRVNVNNVILVEGDLFALHHHVFDGPEDAGDFMVDIWRVEHGMIAEHWVVRQAIPRDMPHDNGIACGQGDDHAGARRLADTIAAPTCGWPDPATTSEDSLAVLDAYTAEFWEGNVAEPVLRWFSADYRQHSPVIADGTEGAIAYLETEYGKGEDQMPEFGGVRMIAEGDYVLSHRLQHDYGASSWTVNIDIFRITDGKISEHWDLRQNVPESAMNDNGSW